MALAHDAGRRPERILAQLDERTREILERRRSRTPPLTRRRLLERALAVADGVGLLVAFALAEILFGTDPTHRYDPVPIEKELLLFAATLPVWAVLARVSGLYDADVEQPGRTTPDDLVGTFQLVSAGAWTFFVAASLSGFADPKVSKLGVFWLLAILGVTSARAAARALCRRRLGYVQNCIVVGAGDVGQLVARKFLESPDYGVNVVGFLDSDPRPPGERVAHLPLLGPPELLPELVRLLEIERVVIAFSGHSAVQLLDLVDTVRECGVRVDIVPRLFDTVGPSASLHTVGGLPLLGFSSVDRRPVSMVAKRLIDVVLAAVGLVVLAPLLALIALAVKLDSPGPALYRRRCIGHRGRPFDMFKFRTMRLETCEGDRYGGDAAGAAFSALMADPAMSRQYAESYKIRDDPRVTRVGRFLRVTSLDELPQLVNVLLGSLSLVGPRAVTAPELPRYGKHLDRLLSVRPGITGYWQINGRSQSSQQDRVRLDLAYVRDWTLGLDLLILAKTVRVLLTRRGAY